MKSLKKLKLDQNTLASLTQNYRALEMIYTSAMWKIASPNCLESK